MLNSTATGLPSTLIVAKRAKVMLTVNVNVSDGLVNGVRAPVIKFKTAKRAVAVLIKFADVGIGLAAIQKSQYNQKQFPFFDTQSILLE